MTVVQQLTPFTCGLACIESVCADFGKDGRQEKLMRDFKRELIADITKIEHFGATSDDLLCYILQRMGFTIARWKDHRPQIQQEQFEKIDLAKGAILITANFNLNSWHCVRFAGMKKDDTLFAMEPSFYQSGIVEYSISNLIKWDYSFVVLTPI